MELTRCLKCGSRRIRRVCETVKFGKRGRKRTYHDVPFERCDARGEEFFGPEAGDVMDRQRRRQRRKSRLSV